MPSVHKKLLLGRVDEVRGLFYVATSFFVIPLIPLVLFVPKGSYLVLSHSERDGSFLGERVALNWRSVLLLYVRWNTFMIATPFAFVGMFVFLTGIANDLGVLKRHEELTLALSIGMAIVVTILYFRSLTARWQITVPVMAILSLLHVTRGLMWQNLQQDQVDPGNLVMPELSMLLCVTASFAAAISSLAGILVPSSLERALANATLLGIPREEVESRLCLLETDDRVG